MQTWDKRWMESHVFFCSLQIKSRACFVCMTVTHFFCPASRTSRRTVISMAFSKETRVSNLLVAISFNRRYWLIFWILSLFVIMPVHLFSSAASMRLTANSFGTKGEWRYVNKRTKKYAPMFYALKCLQVRKLIIITAHMHRHASKSQINHSNTPNSKTKN